MGEYTHIAIVLAGGRGSRMKSSVPKQYLLLNGKPVLYYSLKAMEDSFIDAVILVCGAGEDGYCKKELIDKYNLKKVCSIVQGGKERYDSVYAGLLCCQDTDYVYIHDGARPFLTEEMVQRGYEAVKRTSACVMGMPSKDTVKLADPSGYIKETPNRKIVWNIQTPQIFSYDLIRGAYESIRKKDMTGVTDDAMVVEQETGTKILLVEGSYRNIKITTPEDLAVAEAFLQY